MYGWTAGWPSTAAIRGASSARWSGSARYRFTRMPTAVSVCPLGAESSYRSGGRRRCERLAGAPMQSDQAPAPRKCHEFEI